MFTGIIEATGTITGIKKNKSNVDFSIKAPFHKEIKVDQSIAHNGVCLTVTGKKKDHYTVTAIKETLTKTNLGLLKAGSKINLERCMKADGRFDGHIVQGHVDCTARVVSIKEENGSWLYRFELGGQRTKDGRRKTEDGGQTTEERRRKTEAENLIVEKGSICINGVSRTVVDCQPSQPPVRDRSTASHQPSFSVAIIPYTYHHTNFHAFKPGDFVNIEFDVIGKYVSKMLQTR